MVTVGLRHAVTESLGCPLRVALLGVLIGAVLVSNASAADVAPKVLDPKVTDSKVTDSKVTDPKVPDSKVLDPQAVAFFETKIRPVLVQKCYQCHAAASQELKGGLLLDSREGMLKGGDSGPAVTPGNVKQSLLMDALHYKDLKMPPDAKLPDAVLADFRTWIEQGAVDPRAPVTSTAKVKKEIDFTKARQLWSLQPVRKPDLSQWKPSPWAHSDIDRLVAAAWETKGLQPVPDASKPQLLRRVYFDLTGLPPSAEELQAFVADASPAAFERVIDRLLASPRFGERWGRHWLDLARYADSNGRENNLFFQFAWHYRDYVIDAFNADKPYDRFVIEQVAGDLLPAESPEQRDQLLIATGFLAIGPKTFRSAPELFSMDLIDEQIDVTTRSVLGLTVSCARCHDHKFDAIPTKEYYALAGVFRSTDTLFGPAFFQSPKFDKMYHMYPIGPDAERLGEGAFQYRDQLLKLMAKRDQASVAAYRTQRLIDGIKIERQKTKLTTGTEPPADPELEKMIQHHQQQLVVRNQLMADVKVLEAAPPPLPDFAQGLRAASKPEDCTLRIRGEFDKEGERVPRGVLTLCTPGDKPTIPPDSSGRLELARWLVSRDNPLSARVATNRIWRHLFGRGIVTTVDNFGEIGERPTHPALLDFLASRFMDSGWSTKKMIRDIMLSRVYQLSTQFDTANSNLDPDNEFLWRMSVRRLEVEPLRDAVLAVSGSLKVDQPRGPHVGFVRNGLLEENPHVKELAKESNLRTVYLPIVRGYLQEMLITFDFADPNLLIAQRDERTIPAQSLFMLNSPWIWQQSRLSAQRLLALPDLNDDTRLDWIYQTFLTRQPTDSERQALRQFVARSRDRVTTNTPAAPVSAPAKPGTAPSTAPTAAVVDPELAIWTNVCQALFASAEFRYLQ